MCRFVLENSLRMGKRLVAEEVLSPKLLVENVTSAQLEAEDSVRIGLPCATTFHVSSKSMAESTYCISPPHYLW